MPLSPQPEVRCLLALGSALLGYGLPAHRVEESMLRLARAFGLDITVFGLPTVVMVTSHFGDCTSTYTARAAIAAIDLTRLDALHALIAQVERRELDAAQAEHEVRAILTRPAAHATWSNLVAVVLVALGGALMLGVSLSDALWAGALGLGIGVMLGLGADHPTLARLTPMLATVLATLASCALFNAQLVSHPLVVTIAAMLVLLPGLTVTLAMVELATGHLVSGAARSIGAVAVFLQLGVGVLLGLRLGHIDAARIELLPPAPLEVASLGALLLATGFAVLLVVRVRGLAATLIVCALAFFVCRGLGGWLGVDVGVLVAATTVGVVSHAFARRHDRPSSTLTLPGVMMLVPGSLGLLAVSAAALHDPTRAFDMGIQMALAVVALSTGILLSAAALPPRTSI